MGPILSKSGVLSYLLLFFYHLKLSINVTFVINKLILFVLEDGKESLTYDSIPSAPPSVERNY
jgi:hypothetical protein